MLSCPYCHNKIDIKELPHQGLFKNYRICPYCEGKFTVDKQTKYRQSVCLVLALASLLFTVLLYYGDTSWLIPALVSYLVLGILIYWGNKQVLFVPYNKK